MSTALGRKFVLNAILPIKMLQIECLVQHVYLSAVSNSKPAD